MINVWLRATGSKRGNKSEITTEIYSCDHICNTSVPNIRGWFYYLYILCFNLKETNSGWRVHDLPIKWLAFVWSLAHLFEEKLHVHRCLLSNISKDEFQGSYCSPCRGNSCVDVCSSNRGFQRGSWWYR